MRDMQVPKGNGRIAGVISLTLAAGLLLFLTGCQGPLAPSDAAVTGTVSLTIDAQGTGRAIMPGGQTLASFDAFSVVFSHPVHPNETRDLTPPQAAVEVTLPAGDWTLTVTGLYDGESRARAVVPFTLAAGGDPSPITATLLPIREDTDAGAEGTFAWNLTFPADTTVRRYIHELTDAGGIGDVITLHNDYYVGATWVGTLDLLVDDYFVVFVLERPGYQPLEFGRDLHIFWNLTSTLTETFAADEFIELPPQIRPLDEWIITTGVFPRLPAWNADVTEGLLPSGHQALGVFNFGTWSGAASAEWVVYNDSLSMRVNAVTPTVPSNFGIQFRNPAAGFQLGDTVTVVGRVYAAAAAPTLNRAMVISTGDWDYDPQFPFADTYGFHSFTIELPIDATIAAMTDPGPEIRVHNNEYGHVTAFYIDSITFHRPMGVFVAVTGITGVPTAGTIDVEVTLPQTAAIMPENATARGFNNPILWSSSDVTVTGSTFTATAPGTVTVTATIEDGTALGANWTQNFNIEIGAAPLTEFDVTVAGVVQSVTPETVGAGSTVAISPDGSGFTFTRGGSWEGHYAWFSLDLGANRLVDFETVTLVYEGLAGDLGHKSLQLWASEESFAGNVNVSPGASQVALAVGIGGSAGSPATGTQNVTFTINSDVAADIETQTVYFSIFFNAEATGGTPPVATAFRASDIVFTLGDPCDDCGNFPCTCACDYCGQADCACVLVFHSNLTLSNLAGTGTIAATDFALIQAARPGSVVRVYMETTGGEDRSGWGVGHVGDFNIYGVNVSGSRDVLVENIGSANTNIFNQTVFVRLELWLLTPPPSP